MFAPATVIAGLRSAHARYAAYTAGRMALGFRSLDGEDGYLFEVSDGERRAFFSAAAGTPYAFNRAYAVAAARDKAFAQRILAESGVETIPSRLFFTTKRRAEMRAAGREPEDALAFGRSAAFPVFCKPINGAQGAFAEIVRDAGQFERYLARVAQSHYAMLVQPVIEAAEHRVFVLQRRAVFSYRKTRPRLVGDGGASLAALMLRNAAQKPRDELGLGPAETLVGRDASGRVYGPGDLPAAGVEVVLEGAANRALGGSAEAPVTDVAPAMGAFAVACAGALKLDLAAVDLFATDAGFVVIEVNGNPGLRTLEDFGRWDLIETIWRANFAAALG